MKKFSVIMIALIFLCLGGGTVLAVEWELGHESNFLITEMMELHLKLGMLGEEGVRVPQGFGEAQFSYWGERSLSALRFYLNAGLYGTDHTRFSGAYMYPVNDSLGLQVGLCWERNHGVQDKIASLQGNWQTDLGLVQFGVMGGTRDGVFLECEGEAQLMNRLSLKAGTGVRFEALEQAQKWEIPVGLTLTFDLAKNWNLKFTANDAFPLNNLPDDEPLKLGLSVQTTFDLRGKKVQPEETMETPEELEEIQPIPETSIIDGTDTTTQPVSEEETVIAEPTPAEEIPVVESTNTTTIADQATTEQPSTEQPTGEVTPGTTTENTAETPDTTDQSESIQDEQVGQVDELVESVPTNSYDPVTGILLLNGQKVTVGAIMEGDQAYIPIRYTVRMLGGQVYWYGEPRQISIVLGDVKVLMLTRESRYMRNGETFPLNDGLELWSGHYYILAEQFIELVGIK